MKKKTINNIIKIVVLSIMSIFTLVPFMVLPLISLKTNGEFMKSPLSIPSKLNFSNYITVFKRSNILQAFSNSAIITGTSIFLAIFIGALAAYGLTKMKFAYSKQFSLGFLVPLVFPAQTIVIPIYICFNKIGLLNTRIGLIIVYTATSLPLIIFMLTSFMKTIPIQISESAFIDGASHFRVFHQLILPLLKPVISTIIVISGLGIWNDFFLPMVMITKKSKRTLPLKIYEFMGQYTSDWTLICTCIVYVILPIIILYIFLQKNIIDGVAAGAVKG